MIESGSNGTFEDPALSPAQEKGKESMRDSLLLSLCTAIRLFFCFLFFVFFYEQKDVDAARGHVTMTATTKLKRTTKMNRTTRKKMRTKTRRQ